MAKSLNSITDEKKGLIFKMLAQMPLYEVGVEFGFDKQYKDATAVRNIVYRIYQQVLKDPEKFSVSKDVVEVVTSVVSNRSVASKESTLREKQDQAILDSRDIKEVVVKVRDQALDLVQRKMQLIGSSKKRLDEANISSLAQVFGIIFDKAQIVQGQATEHIAVLGKVDKDIKPDDAINMILKFREVNVADKDRKATKK